MKIPNIRDRSIYPDMARWFSPGLLTKLLWNVFLSDVFGQYADRRLIVAALDTYGDDELMGRTKLKPDPTNEIWFDFVADLGDGFDATYAIATLLAKQTLTVDGYEGQLPRGEMLIMGGDEVYPAATQNAYRFQLQSPYSMAFPDSDVHSPKGVPLYAIPGNHDWYDGLVMFLAFSRDMNRCISVAGERSSGAVTSRFRSRRIGGCGVRTFNSLTIWTNRRPIISDSSPHIWIRNRKSYSLARSRVGSILSVPTTPLKYLATQPALQLKLTRVSPFPLSFREIHITTAGIRTTMAYSSLRQAEVVHFCILHIN